MEALGRKSQVLLVGEQRFEPYPQAFEAVCKIAGDDAVFQLIPDSLADKRSFPVSDQPDLVVVVQSWPDQYTVADVNEIMTRFAHAKILCCYGPWCDSDGRTRSIWPLAVRVPVSSLARRLALEWSRSSRLPLTASRTEIFEFDVGEVGTGSHPDRTVAIDSPDRQWREMIASQLMRHGFQIFEQGDQGVPHLILFDTDPWGDHRRNDLAEIRRKFPGMPIVACTGLPTADLRSELSLLGCHANWFKLTFLDELTHLAERIVG